MKKTVYIWSVIVCSFLCVTLATPQDASLTTLVQGRLTEPGATPFHLRAVVTERGDPSEPIEVEITWVAPDKWRRTIRGQAFSQTLIVNGDKLFEQDSDDYFPLGIRVLTTALVDPTDVLSAIRPGDQMLSKANGNADESGKVCFDAATKMCALTRLGLFEFVGAAGRSVDFTDYQKFENKRIARLLIYHIDPGDSLQAKVLTLGKFKSHDESVFAITEATPREKQNRNAILPEAELRALANPPTEIIWPQVLEDQTTRGETSYYVSVDRSGQVREVLPLKVSIERADDSARRQIMRWKFKPALKDGVAVQAEAVLNFHFDTRAYGPKSPLTDAEVRHLATNTVAPEFPPGSKPGDACRIRIAVDSEGKVIEQIAVSGSDQLTVPCMNAIGKWNFSPITENGRPRPYRAEVAFRVP